MQRQDCNLTLPCISRLSCVVLFLLSTPPALQMVHTARLSSTGVSDVVHAFECPLWSWQDSYAQQAPYVPAKPAQQPAAPPSIAAFNPAPAPPTSAYGAASFSSAYSAPVPQQQPPTQPQQQHQQQQPAIFQPTVAPPPAQLPAASLYR